MSKEIKIKWTSDDSEIDKSLTKLQTKMQQMSRSNAQMSNITESGGTLSSRASYAQRQFQQTSGDLLKKESRELEQTQRTENIAMLSKKRELIQMQKVEGSITAEKQKQIDLLKQEINLRSQKVMDLEAAKNKINQSIKDMGPQTSAPPPAGGGGNGPVVGSSSSSGNGSGMGFMSFLAGASAAGILAGGLNATAVTGMQYAAERRGNITRAEGSGISGVSRDLREQFGGKGSDSFFYAKERAEASEITKDQFKDKRTRDVMGAGGSAMVGGALGGVAGAAAGSTLAAAIALGLATVMSGGVALPVAGAMMALGGVGGAMVGAGAGAGRSLGQQGITTLFDKEKYDKQNLVDALKNREENESSLIMQDPRKFLAREHFQKNIGKYSTLQRQLGLGDQATFGSGGYVQSQMNKGEQYGGGLLGEDAVLGQYNTLRGSSGLTGSRELAGNATAMNRQFGIENSGDSMGKMMGRGLGVTQTEDAFKKIMAEAVKMGVDTTKMSAEMQNFTAMAAEISTAGGGFSGTAASQLAGISGDFGSGALSASASQFQEFQERSGQGGGFEGQLGFGFMQGGKGEEAFGKDMMGKIKKDPALMNMLNQMSASELEKDDKLLQGMVDDLTGEGGNKEDTRKQLMEGMDKKDLFKNSRTQKGEDLLKKYKDSIGTEDEKSAYYELTKQRGTEYGKEYFSQGSLNRTAENKLAAGVRSGAGSEELGKIDSAMMSSTGRAAEGEMSAQAIGDKLRINEMSKYTDKYLEASKKTTESTILVSEQFEKLSTMIKDKNIDLEKTLTTLNKQLEKMSDTMSEGGNISAKPK